MNELGLDVEVYYASEVNEDAKLVATCHHAVTHVGDAWRLTRDRVGYTVTIVYGGETILKRSRPGPNFVSCSTQLENEIYPAD